MIKIKNNNINFGPRKGIKVPSCKYKSLSSYTCTTCKNVVFSQFITDKVIDPFLYEETFMTNELGDNTKIWPTDFKLGTKTLYKSDHFKYNGEIVQTIKLQNHVLDYNNIYKVVDRIKGRETCVKTNILLYNKELIHNIMLVCLSNNYSFSGDIKNPALITSLMKRSTAVDITEQLQISDSSMIDNLLLYELPLPTVAQGIYFPTTSYK